MKNEDRIDIRISPLIIFLCLLIGTYYGSIWILDKGSEIYESEKLDCYNTKGLTNDTFDSVKNNMFIKDDKCCILEEVYYYQESHREQGTLTFFLFGSGKGQKMRHNTICEDKQ